MWKLTRFWLSEAGSLSLFALKACEEADFPFCVANCLDYYFYLLYLKHTVEGCRHKKRSLVFSFIYFAVSVCFGIIPELLIAKSDATVV